MRLEAILLLFASTCVLFAAETNQFNPAPPAAAAFVERGRYLVENAAMCAECHTPKTDDVKYDRTAWLQGDVLDYKPVHPMPFAAVAPGIAGLPMYASDGLAVRFLETGITWNGKPAMPPMPQYRFHHDDAVAVVAYLRSLKRQAGSGGGSVLKHCTRREPLR